MIAPAEGYDYGASQGQEHNTIYIADGQRFSTTKTNMLPISLKNEDEIVGFQFDVVLPQGMTLAKNASALIINKFLVMTGMLRMIFYLY